MYRPPSIDSTSFNDLCNYVIDITQTYPNAIICCSGDFNIPDIDWTDESILGHRYPQSISELALSMSAKYGFAQMVDFPTRNENILDLFFTNRPSLIQYCYAAPGISDHDIVKHL